MTLTAVLTVVVTTLGGSAGIVGLLTLAVNRGGRRADVANTIAEASEKLFARFEKELAELDEVKRQCAACQTRLTAAEERERRSNAALRALIRVIDSNDPDAIKEAVAAAQNLM